jgi:hypothetical protein
MKQILALILPVFFCFMTSANDARFFELRTYTAAPGKMEALQNRFRKTTLRLFEKHGMENLGYWVPLDQAAKPEDKLIFLLAYPSKEAREKSWQGFLDDPEWKEVFKASEATGALVTKADSLYLTATDYSPEIKISKGTEPRTFELRTYKTPPGRLANLHARFRDHTVKLFSKHGMSHFGYWTPVEDTQGSHNTLVYILVHKNREDAAASFDAFRKDPDWTAARKASEEKAGGSLTVATNGVRSVFMNPTDFSPTR